ncbi:uncharacterized protein F4822DRAFT_157102 [Hypoxylon trugodes]|uniref:uncharacterized protein n=1 Tax=Hypoxylon trugodes TaxID=326681 RepID=UPI0021996BD9|nr:uncharacterized protein F4822DRAFT_157102 [Hypoxylon trugodes]KAI1390658.1 hypothetical protein F4822DRAFT_157102 [Hypoxylon trugodes]
MASLANSAALLPPCAKLACLNTAISNSNCPPTDQACIYSTGAINNNATLCIKAACTVRELLVAQNVTNRPCGVEPAVNSTYVPIMIAFITLAAVAVSLQLLARVLTDMPIWWDDGANCTSMVTCIAYTVTMVQLKSGGFGTDIWAIPTENITSQLKGYYILGILYVVACVLFRASIILYYIRVFRGSQSKQLMWNTLVVNFLIGLPFTTVSVFRCRPISYAWLQWDGQHTGYCVNDKIFTWLGFMIPLVFDFWVLIVPLPSIMKLQLSLKRKILIFIMFSTGLS